MTPRLKRRLLVLAVLAGCDGSQPDLPTAAPAGNRLASEQLRVTPDSLHFIVFTERVNPLASGAPAGAAPAGGAGAGQAFPGGDVESGTVPGDGGGALPAALALVKPLVLTNEGATPMAWSAAESVDWLSVSPDSGTLAAGESRTLEVTVDSALLGIDEYRTHVLLTTGSTTRGVPVAVSAVWGRVLPSRREAWPISNLYGPFYFLVSVPAEADSLHVSVSVRERDDRVDLYVRRGELPGPGIADCAPPGMWRYEDCDIPVSSAGDYFIMVEVDDWEAEGWTGSLRVYAPVPEAPYVPTLPLAPSNLTVTGAGPQRVDVGWRRNSFNANAQRLHRSTRGPDGTFGPYQRLGTRPGYWTSFIDSTVALGATYRYRVEACDHHLCATSAPSGPITVIQPPGPATHLAARAHPGPRIDLSWSGSGSRASSYQVWRSTRRPDGSYPPYTWFAGTRTSAYSDAAVIVGQRYAYHVRGCNAFGCSTASSPVNAAVPPPPAAPTALRARVYSATRVDLGWTDASTNESCFNVRRSLRRPDGSFAPYQTLAVLGPGVTSYIDRTVATGGTYRYVIQACNTGGCGSSASAGVTVPAS